MPAHSWILTGFGRITPSPQWRTRSHSHEISELIVIFNGILHVKEPDGTMHKGKAGHVFLYPAGCWHAEESDKNEPVETIYLGFKGSAGEKIIPVYDCDRRIRTLAHWIWNSRHDVHSRLEQLNRTFLQAIREEFVRLQHLPAAKNAFDAVRGFVLQNLDRKITLDELAENQNMSKFHFIREYKKKNGLSPMAQVRRIRIEEAKNLISGTTLPLKAIAPMVGMANEYQLSAAIRKYAGQSPRKLRNRQLM